MNHHPVARRDVALDRLVGGAEEGLGVTGVLVGFALSRIVEEIDADDLDGGAVETRVGVALFLCAGTGRRRERREEGKGR